MKKLTTKENKAQKLYLSILKIKKRKTKKPIVVALVGLIGSGKSSVVNEIAKHISGNVVEADQIRNYLRQQNEKFENARKIVENVTLEIIKTGGNVVLDSDYVEADKRASLRKKLKKTGAQIFFIRTYADRDVFIHRLRVASYVSHPLFKNPDQAIREMWRRTPHHYSWDAKNGGNWLLKTLSFKIFATIDTTDSKKWPGAVKKMAQKIINLY